MRLVSIYVAFTFTSVVNCGWMRLKIHSGDTAYERLVNDTSEVNDSDQTEAFQTIRYPLGKRPIYGSQNQNPMMKYEIDPKQVERSLGLFVNDLRFYFNETSFESRKFELAVPGFRKELAKNNILVESESSSQELLDQLTFAKHVFLIMVDSAKGMHYYSDVSNPCHRLMHSVIELNVRILTVLDARGKLDVHIDSYEAELALFKRCLEMWTEKFANLMHVSIGERLVFATQVKQVQTTLAMLEKQIPFPMTPLSVQ
ncbi:hypothetical protein OXX59_000980 [Metschnikowia pulcherrima]